MRNPFKEENIPADALVGIDPAATSQELEKQQENNKLIGYSIENARAMMHLGTELARFISEKGLAANIQGKQYVQVEGWQFAGNMLGLTCYAEKEPVDLSTDKEIRFRAYATVFRISDGAKISTASMTCSNKEKGKERFEPYAVESMAQTRAQSKAYRMYLSWLVKAAGFETTPYEEMDGVPVQHIVMASEKQYNEIAELGSDDELKPEDLTPDQISRIQNQELTEKEAQNIIKYLKDLIAERCY